MEGGAISQPAATAAALTVQEALALIAAGAPGFTSRMMAEEGTRPCDKSKEAGTECVKRLEPLDEDDIDLLKTMQPARPVLPRFQARAATQTQTQLDRDCIRAVQDIRDLDWDLLTQHSAYGRAYAWVCDCDTEDEILALCR